jgi:GH25 family lysozyme M1 (1,4-beta-N-acetylmuramidase)
MKNWGDLSHYDDRGVNYQDMWDAGIRMVGLKATQGNSNTDATYQAAYAAAKKVGLGVVSYTYIEPNEAGSDIVKYESIAHLGKGDVAAVDAEALGLSKVTTFAAMDDLIAKGIKCVLYCNRDYYENTLNSPTQYVLWIASYPKMPVLPSGVKVFAHQYSENDTCPGVPGTCDMNSVLVSDEEFESFLIQ